LGGTEFAGSASMTYKTLMTKKKNKNVHVIQMTSVDEENGNHLPGSWDPLG